MSTSVDSGGATRATSRTSEIAGTQHLALAVLAFWLLSGSNAGGSSSGGDAKSKETNESSCELHGEQSWKMRLKLRNWMFLPRKQFETWLVLRLRDG